MSDRDQRRGLQERIGVTVSSGSLQTDPFDIGQERARERIGALGAATLVCSKEPTREPVRTKWDDRRRLAGMLWRLKFGECPDPTLNIGSATEGEAATLFAWYLRRHRMFERFQSTPRSTLLKGFARRAIQELCHDKCAHCGGTKLAGVDAQAAARNMLRLKRCQQCVNHPGQPRIDHAARVRALGLPAGSQGNRIYRFHFERRFRWAHEELKRIVQTMRMPVARQLGRPGLANIQEDE
jgi:hypothetical protein